MHQDFTEGEISKKLVFFAIPIVAGMLLQTAYNITDTIFIGMMGPKELAAVSLSFPVIYIFIALASGLGIGANALISQAIGRKDIHSANNYAEHALFLGGILAVLIAIGSILAAPPIFSLLGADKELASMATEYSTPVFVGFIFMFFWFICDSILKAQGNSKASLNSLIASVILNAILDPLFIFGFGPIPAMGLFGVALATVFSQIVSAAMCFYYIHEKKSAITLSLKDFRPKLEIIKKIFTIGVPSSASQMLNAGGFLLLMGIVGGFGSYAIAAFGIGLRINAVIILPLIGISSAVAVFAGQNIGAKNHDRAKKVTIFGSKIGFIVSIVFAGTIMLFPSFFMRIFTGSKEVILIGAAYLSIVPASFMLQGLYFPIIWAFNGAGKTKIAFIINLAYWLSAAILARLLSTSLGLSGIWIAMVIAAAICLLAAEAIFFTGYGLSPTTGK